HILTTSTVVRAVKVRPPPAGLARRKRAGHRVSGLAVVGAAAGNRLARVARRDVELPGWVLADAWPLAPAARPPSSPQGLPSFCGTEAAWPPASRVAFPVVASSPSDNDSYAILVRTYPPLDNIELNS